MQDTSNISNYDQIIAAGDYKSEAKVRINGVDYLENAGLFSIKTRRSLFRDNNPGVGFCVSNEIDLTITLPLEEIPAMAEIRPFIRIRNSQLISGWLPKGVYYIDERDVNEWNDRLTIHGYDAMMLANADYPSSTLSWPAKDRAVLEEVATAIGVEIDARTLAVIPAAGQYYLQFPAQYTMRDALCTIAGLYAGNFTISEEGKLLLVALNGLPEEENYLITENGDYITFGGTKILLN